MAEISMKIYTSKKKNDIFKKINLYTLSVVTPLIIKTA